jgi:hypothetical protein
MSILGVNQDCLCYIAMNLDAASKYMFTLATKTFLGLRKHHKKLFADRRPTQIVNAALKMGRIRLLRFLKSLGVKYVGNDILNFKVRSLGRLKWFVDEIEPLNIEDKRRLSCLITAQSDRSCDEYVCSLTDAREMALRPKVCLFEKWNKPVPSLETYLAEMMENPYVIGLMCAQRTLSEVVNQNLVNVPTVRKKFYLDIMFAAFKSHYFDFCDGILGKVQEDKDEEYIKTLSKVAIAKCDVGCLMYLRERRILADHTFLSTSIKSCFVSYLLLNNLARYIDFFRWLFHIGVEPPLDIFTDRSSSWRRCRHYIFIKFFISRGVHPDTSGKILEKFPEKREELISMGFR